MASKKKSPAPTGLGKIVLPGKEAFGKILTDIESEVNTQEAAEIVLEPFFDIVNKTKRGLK